MRKTFFDSLLEVATTEKDLFFITADLGFGFIESYKTKFPDQYLNVGVSEQAMLGMANGLAAGGKKVICYSIASFSLIRPFEFFRNGAIFNNNPVMVVGVGPGFDYSQDGLSHYCLEDLAILQSQPGVVIKMPVTEKDVKQSVTNFIESQKPTYLRLPRNFTNFPSVNILEDLDLNSDVLIITTALMAKRANEISKDLKDSGISTQVRHLSEISDDVDAALINNLRKINVCLVVEDHYIFGGIGTRISKLIAENNLNIPIVIDGVDKIARGTIGSFDFMTNKLMQNKMQILNRVKKFLK